MLFAGSVAAITGAAGGIGLAVDEEAVRRGMAVAISDRRNPVKIGKAMRPDEVEHQPVPAEPATV